MDVKTFHFLEEFLNVDILDCLNFSLGSTFLFYKKKGINLLIDWKTIGKIRADA